MESSANPLLKYSLLICLYYLPIYFNFLFTASLLSISQYSLSSYSNFLLLNISVSIYYSYIHTGYLWCFHRQNLLNCILLQVPLNNLSGFQLIIMSLHCIYFILFQQINGISEILQSNPLFPLIWIFYLVQYNIRLFQLLC